MTTPPAPPAPPPAPPPASAPASGAAPAAPATPAPPPAPAPSGAPDDRLGRLEATVNRLAGLVEGRTTAPAAAPDIEAIARAEIARGQAKKEEEDAAAKAEGRLKAIEANVAKLAETKPKEPTRRITRLLWPGHDRD